MYSLNIVGYVNVELKPGYNMVANPLDNGAGNISSNLVPDALVNGSQVLVYNPGSGYATTSAKKAGAWSPVYTINPGTGYFVRNLGSTSVTNTYVGSIASLNVTNSIAVGYNLKGSLLPIGGVSSNMGPNSLNFGDILPNGSQVLVYNNPGGYATTSAKKAGAWTPVYTLNVGQGFFIRNLSNAPAQWTQSVTP